MEMFYKESKGTHSMVNTKEQLVELGQASLLTKGTGVQYWEGRGTDFYTYLD